MRRAASVQVHAMQAGVAACQFCVVEVRGEQRLQRCLQLRRVVPLECLDIRERCTLPNLRSSPGCFRISVTETKWRGGTREGGGRPVIGASRCTAAAWRMPLAGVGSRRRRAYSTSAAASKRSARSLSRRANDMTWPVVPARLAL